MMVCKEERERGVKAHTADIMQKQCGYLEEPERPGAIMSQESVQDKRLVLERLSLEENFDPETPESSENSSIGVNRHD